MGIEKYYYNGETWIYQSGDGSMIDTVTKAEAKALAKSAFGEKSQRVLKNTVEISRDI